MTDEYRRRIVLDMDFDRAMSEMTQAFRAEGMEPIARTDVHELFRRSIGHDMHDLKRFVIPRLPQANRSRGCSGIARRSGTNPASPSSPTSRIITSRT